MCGVAGIWSRDHKISNERVKKMIHMLDHRGPDGVGFFIKENIGLAHARLSIIDLSTGKQPIHNENKNIWVVFNGEIFNYLEIRKDLERRGHRFYTKTDTEVLVHLYEQYGTKFVDHLNGQFAIAIWDDQNQKLVLTRDRVGITPLYYKSEGDFLLFASEIKAIIAGSNVPPEPNYNALDQIMTFWAPVSPCTMFKDVYEVSPGEIIEVSAKGMRKYRYWDWTFPVDGQYRPGSINDLKEELLEILVDSTRIRLRSDVPVGAYLSGGLDSSVLVSLIHNYGNVPLRTFSIGFEDETLDERKYQEEMIEYIGATHSNILCHERDIADSFENVIWHSEIPILRTAPAPMMMLSGLVHNKGYKVVLTGEGSDEVLGGYDIFKEAKIRQFWSKYPDSKLRPLLLKRLYPYLDLSHGQSYLQNFFGAGLNDPSLPYFSHLPRWITTSRTKEFFSEELKKSLLENGYEGINNTFPKEMKFWHPFNKGQYIESKNLMSGYLLSSQGDRMLMSNSVEGRFPFLDHRLIEFANSIHPKYKMKALNEKYLLKKTMRDQLPRSIVKRFKQPYRAPDIPAFIKDGQIVDSISEYFEANNLKSSGYFDFEKVSRLIKKIQRGRVISYKDNMAFVAILSTQVWHKKFIETAM